jgi:cAMP-dependent protein kinase regulator
MARLHAAEPDDVAALLEHAAASLQQAVRRPMRAGDVLVEEGEPAGPLFVVVSGAVEVVRRGADGSRRVVARMPAGEVFGEMSLLSGAPRLATVIAVEDGELLELGRAELDAITRRRPRVAEAVRRLYGERLLANVLRANALLEGLSEDRRRALVELVRLETYEAGSVIVPQGMRGKAFYVLLRGQCDASHAVDGMEESHPPMVEGDVFGEIALLQGGTTTARVRAGTRCVVVVLQSEWFDELLLRDPAVREGIYDLAARRLQRTQALVMRDGLDRGLV